MIRTQEWSLWSSFAGRASEGGDPTTTFEPWRPVALYNRKDDPGEERNLAEDPACRGIRKHLLNRLAGQMRATEDPWLRYLAP